MSSTKQHKIKRSLRRTPLKNTNGLNIDAERLLMYLQTDGDDIPEREELTPHLKNKLQRITQAKSWLFEHKSQRKVAKMMANFYGYHEVTAYRDLALMQKVFGPVMNMSKEMKRAVAEEMILQDREMAKAKKDVKALNMTTANYIKLHQLDKQDPELPDVSEFEIPQLILAVLPEQVGQQPPSDDELLDRVSDWFQEQSEDVSYDEA